MPPYTYFGMRGMGKPVMLPQQQFAVRDRINSLAGSGVEQGYRDRESDPMGNLSPTEQAGTTMSRPRRLAPAPNMPNILSSMPNQNGLSIPANVSGMARTPTFVPSRNEGSMDIRQLEEDENSIIKRLPALDGLTRRTNVELLARAPSQVDLLTKYKEQMSQMQNPYQVARQETANRGTGGKILDAVLNGIGNLGQGGILGGLAGGIAGYRGIPRQQAIINRVKEENALKRQGLQDQFNLDQAILGQQNIESDDFQKQQDLAFKQDKEFNDQEQAKITQQRQERLDQIKLQHDQDLLDVQRGQLSINDYNARRQMLEFELQKVEKLFPGQVLTEGSRALNLPAGFRVPDRPADRPTVGYTDVDKYGIRRKINTKDYDSAPEFIDTGRIPREQRDPNEDKDLERQAQTQAIESINRDFPGGVMKNPQIDEATWKQIEQIKKDEGDVWGTVVQRKLGINPNKLYVPVDKNELILRTNQAYERLKQGRSSTSPASRSREYTATDLDKYKANRSNKQYRQAFINKFGVDPESLIGK